MKALQQQPSTHASLLLTAVSLTLAACGGDGGGSSGGNSPDGSTPPPVVANAPPSISGLPATQKVAQDSNSGPVAFGISDAQSAAGSVSVAVASSNPELIPADAIQLLGNDADRALVITPMDGVSGTATITVTATDSSGQSTQQPIDVTVTSTQRSFVEMVNTSFTKPLDAAAEETSGFNWVDNPEEDPTAFDNLTAP